MSYTRHDFQADDVLTAAQMNNLNDGIDEAIASSFDIKTLTWIGNGQASKQINFEKPVKALLITGGRDSRNYYIVPLQAPSNKFVFYYAGATVGLFEANAEWSEDKKQLTITGENAETSFNSSAVNYVCTYM